MLINLKFTTGLNKLTLHIMATTEKQYNLESFDDLECPVCDKICKPTKVVSNTLTVSYKHECNNGTYTFKINENGDLID